MALCRHACSSLEHMPLWISAWLLCLAALTIAQPVVANEAICAVYVDVSISEPVASWFMTRLVTTSAATNTKLCGNSSVFPLFDKRGIDTATDAQGVSFHVPFATLSSWQTANESTPVLFFYLGAEATWIAQLMLSQQVSYSGLKAAHIVVPMTLPILMWARVSHFSVVFSAVDTSNLFLVDTDPFAVGAMQGSVVGAVVAVSQNSSTQQYTRLTAVSFSGFPETRRAAAGFAYGVQMVCSRCDVDLIDVEITVGLVQSEMEALFEYAMSNATAVESAVVFSSPLPVSSAYHTRHLFQAALQRVPGGIPLTLMYSEVIRASTDNSYSTYNLTATQVLGMSLNLTTTAAPWAAVRAASQKRTDSSFGAAVNVLEYAIMRARVVLQGQVPRPVYDAALAAVQSPPPSSVCASDGSYVPSSTFEWSTRAMGYAWPTVKSTVAAVGCLLVYVDVEFNEFSVFDPQRNIFLTRQPTNVTSVTNYQLVAVPVAPDGDGGTFHVYAIGGYNESVTDGFSAAALQRVPIAVRRMVLTVRCSDQSAFTVAVPWNEIFGGGGFVPQSRIGHSLVAYGQSVLMYGGATLIGTMFRTLFSFSVTTLTWSLLSASGVFVQGHSAALYTDQYNSSFLYTVGGLASGQIVSSINKFDLSRRVWSTFAASTEIAASNGCLVMKNTHLIFFGGIGGTKAVAVASLVTGQIATNKTLLFGSRSPLSCDVARFGDKEVVVSVATGSNALNHRLTMPRSLHCAAQDNQVELYPATACITCPAGSFADETCKACGTSAITVAARPTWYCDGLTDASLESSVLVPVLIPVSVGLATVLLVLLYLSAPESDKHAFRSPRNAPQRHHPTTVVSVVVEDAATLWAKKAKEMSSTIQRVVEEQRRLAALYGSFEHSCTGDESVYCNNNKENAVRWALHVFHSIESDAVRSTVGRLQVRILLHAADGGDLLSDHSLSGCAKEVVESAHSGRLTHGVYVSTALWNAYQAAAQCHGKTTHDTDAALEDVASVDMAAAEMEDSGYHPNGSTHDSSVCPMRIVRTLPQCTVRGAVAVPTSLPFFVASIRGDGFAIDLNVPTRLCIAPELLDVAGRTPRGGRDGARFRRLRIEMVVAAPQSGDKGSVPTSPRLPARSMSSANDTTLSASESPSSEWARLGPGWETHPLITMEVLSSREFACITRIVERMYEAMLAPLSKEEVILVQEALAEHLRLYVDSEPGSKQRNVDVAMRALTMIDMLYTKEVVQQLASGGDESSGGADGSDTNIPR